MEIVVLQVFISDGVREMSAQPELPWCFLWFQTESAPLHYHAHQPGWNSLCHSATANMSVKAPCQGSMHPPNFGTNQVSPLLGLTLILCASTPSLLPLPEHFRSNICYRNMCTIQFWLLLCRPASLCRSALNRDTSRCAAATVCADTSIPAPSDPKIKAVLLQCGWIKHTAWPFAGFHVFRSLHSLEKALQLCLTVVFLTQPMHGLQTPKGSCCLRFLSGWRGGRFSQEMPELCLLFSLLFHCQTLLGLHTALVFGAHMCNPQELCRVIIMLWWQAASPGLQAIPNCPHFMKYMGEKREVWLFSLPPPPGASWALLWTGPWWNQPPGWLPEWGCGGWAEPVWGVAVATFPNVLSFNAAKSQEQRASGKTNTIMQNKPGSQSEHWPLLLSWQRKSLL